MNCWIGWLACRLTCRTVLYRNGKKAKFIYELNQIAINFAPHNPRNYFYIFLTSCDWTTEWMNDFLNAFYVTKDGKKEPWKSVIAMCRKNKINFTLIFLHSMKIEVNRTFAIIVCCVATTNRPMTNTTSLEYRNIYHISNRHRLHVRRSIYDLKPFWHQPGCNRSLRNRSGWLEASRRSIY